MTAKRFYWPTVWAMWKPPSASNTDLAEPITLCLMFIASFPHGPPRINLGSGVVNFARYHAAMIAGLVAMLDHMLKGRFMIGIGPGAALRHRGV